MPDPQNITLIILLLLLIFLFYKMTRLHRRNVFQNKIIQQKAMAVSAIIETEEKEMQYLIRRFTNGFGVLTQQSKTNITDDTSYTDLVSEDIVSVLDRSLQEMRNASDKTMPGAVMRNGLSRAVKNLIENAEKQKIEINHNLDDLHDSYHPDFQIVLYSIFQECINNVLQHAKATKLYISLIKNKNYIDATIEDNGVGFNQLLLREGAGSGLKNIKERISFLKGILDISSEKGKGTLVAFHVPLKPKQ